MIEILISSKTRIKLLLRFFLNSDTKSYLRNLEAEFGESTNAIRLELNKFEKAGMLISEVEGNRKYFKANTRHPLFQDINNIVFKYIGLDWIVDYVAKRLGHLQMVYLTDLLPMALTASQSTWFLSGEINEAFLKELLPKGEEKIEQGDQLPDC